MFRVFVSEMVRSVCALLVCAVYASHQGKWRVIELQSLWPSVLYVCICRITHTFIPLEMFKSVDVEGGEKSWNSEIHPGYKSCSLSVRTSPSQPDRSNKTLTQSREICCCVAAVRCSASKHISPYCYCALFTFRPRRSSFLHRHLSPSSHL